MAILTFPVQNAKLLLARTFDCYFHKQLSQLANVAPLSSIESVHKHSTRRKSEAMDRTTDLLLDNGYQEEDLVGRATWFFRPFEQRTSADHLGVRRRF